MIRKTLELHFVEDIRQVKMVVARMYSARRGGLVFSALDSESRGPGSSPGRVIVLCSWARHLTPHSASLHPGV